MYFLFYAILELKPDDILNFKILLSLGQVDQNKVCFEFILFSVLLEWKRVCVWGGGNFTALSAHVIFFEDLTCLT